MITSSPVTVKGGLMFTEDVSQQAIYLNPNGFTVTRQAKTDILISGLQLTRDITLAHHKHCQHISNLIDTYNTYNTTSPIKSTTLLPTTEFVIAPIKNHLLHSSTVCKSINARTPEIRTVAQRETIRKLAIDNNITFITAGITYDWHGPLYRFRSNEEDAMKNSPFGNLISYGGDYAIGSYKADYNDHWVRSYAVRYPLIYAFPHDTFSIHIASDKEKWTYQKIICEQPIKEKLKQTASVKQWCIPPT